MCRLGDVGNCAVGQNQVEADNGVDGETVLIGLVRVPCQRFVSEKSGGEPPETDLRRVRSRQRRSVT